MAFQQVEFHGIHTHGPEGFHAAILRMPGTNRILPVWLSEGDAKAIAGRIAGHHPKRPSAHDMLADTFMRLTSGCQAIRINSSFEGVFIAAVVTNDGEEVDARPSDALMLSRLLELPIEIDKDIFMQSSIFLNNADLAEYFDISSDAGHADMDGPISASGDAQADADFEELMQSMGVFETDLLGETSEAPEEDADQPDEQDNR